MTDSKTIGIFAGGAIAVVAILVGVLVVVTNDRSTEITLGGVDQGGAQRQRHRHRHRDT